MAHCTSDLQATKIIRQVAEGFGADAGRYDRARPAYPAGLADRIIARAGFLGRLASMVW